MPKTFETSWSTPRERIYSKTGITSEALRVVKRNSRRAFRKCSRQQLRECKSICTKIDFGMLLGTDRLDPNHLRDDWLLFLAGRKEKVCRLVSDCRRAAPR